MRAALYRQKGPADEVEITTMDRCPGRRWRGGWKRAFGTAAEMITLRRIKLRRSPTISCPWRCLGIRTHRCHAVIRGSISGKTILISSGGGVVGRYCTGARALGAGKIITTASSLVSRDTAAGGADTILNYKPATGGRDRPPATVLIMLLKLIWCQCRHARQGDQLRVHRQLWLSPR